MSTNAAAGEACLRSMVLRRVLPIVLWLAVAACGSGSGGAGLGAGGSGGQGLGTGGAGGGGPGLGSGGGSGSVCSANAEQTAGAACARAYEGSDCSDVQICPGGLVITQLLRCDHGRWIAGDEACPPLDGTLNSAGCTAMPPPDGASCKTPRDGACYYVRMCPAQPCDAGQSGGGGSGGGCTSLGGTSVFATCADGKWHAPPLLPCP
jgi:hypothetical protein